MTILRLLGLIVITGALSSCLPAPYGAYYRPSYPDNSATFERRDCGRSAGPYSWLKLTAQDGSILRVTLKKNRQNRLELWMGLHLSGFSTLQFTSDVIRLSDLEEGTEWTIEAKALSLSSPVLSGPIPYNQVVDFGKVAPTAPEQVLNDLEVWIPFSIRGFSPDAVRMHLPEIIAGNDKYPIPSILLEADMEKREYKKGRWDWWPYKWKHVKINGFTISGGATGGLGVFSKVDVRLKVPELGGNIMVYFPADMKWKFATNVIRFEDVNSGEVRQIHFTHLRPVFNTEVTFTAPFCCTTYAGAEVPIGDTWPEKLRVQIPPLLINGKEFVIKPITFDLRRFDVGIVPFNC